MRPEDWAPPPTLNHLLSTNKSTNRISVRSGRAISKKIVKTVKPLIIKAHESIWSPFSIDKARFMQPSNCTSWSYKMWVVSRIEGLTMSSFCFFFFLHQDYTARSLISWTFYHISRELCYIRYFSAYRSRFGAQNLEVYTANLVQGI